MEVAGLPGLYPEAIRARLRMRSGRNTVIGSAEICSKRNSGDTCRIIRMLPLALMAGGRWQHLEKPAFMTVYLTALDHIEHETGPFSKESLAVLERLDAVVEKLRQTAEGQGPAVICVVSDHGFAKTDKELNLNSALRQAGLIGLNPDGSVKSWRASAWLAGGSAAIVLQDLTDSDVSTRVRQLLNRMLADPNGGIARVLEPAELEAGGGFPGAAFVVGLKPGYQLGPKLDGPVVVPRKAGGMHGYLPENPDMRSSFFLVGPGIQRGFSLGIIDMRDIAPTLGEFLGFELSTSPGHSLVRKMEAASTR